MTTITCGFIRGTYQDVRQGDLTIEAEVVEGTGRNDRMFTRSYHFARE